MLYHLEVFFYFFLPSTLHLCTPLGMEFFYNSINLKRAMTYIFGFLTLLAFFKFVSFGFLIMWCFCFLYLSDKCSNWFLWLGIDINIVLFIDFFIICIIIYFLYNWTDKFPVILFFRLALFVLLHIIFGWFGSLLLQSREESPAEYLNIAITIAIIRNGTFVKEQLVIKKLLQKLVLHYFLELLLHEKSYLFIVQFQNFIIFFHYWFLFQVVTFYDTNQCYQ